MSQTIKKDLQVTAEKDKIPVGEKAAYSVCEVANTLPGYMPNYLAKQIFNFSMGVPATYVTIVLALFRLVDAFTDPLVGYWSDNFRSRLGRRRPFLIMGIIVMAITLPLIFLVPRELSHTQIMIWFFLFGTLFYFGLTLHNIPYQSMALEMTPDYHERTSISGYRAVTAKIMSIAGGWIWYLTQLPVFADETTGQPDTLNGAFGVACAISVTILAVGFIPVIFCKERYYKAATKAKKENFWRSFRLTIGCRPFRLMLIMMIFLNIPQLTNGLGAYLTTYGIFGGVQRNAALLMGWSNTISIALSLFAVPMTLWISRRIGKERLLFFIILFNIPIALAYWFIYTYATPETAWWLLLPPLLHVPIVAGFWMVIPSMQADIVDYDELETGERREGSFAAVFSWFLKLSGTLMVGFSGPIIDLVGFRPEYMGDQPDGVFLKMRILIAAVPIFAVICQLIILKRYPISPEVARQNREKLEARRGEIS